MDDRIEIRGLRVTGFHGVFESERRGGQPFVVDADLEIDLRAASASDSLDDTVDYGVLAARLAAAVRETRFQLIEALAGHLADLALEDPRVRAARVRVAKPEVPVEVSLAEVAVTVHRTEGDRAARRDEGDRAARRDEGDRARHRTEGGRAAEAADASDPAWGGTR